MPATLRFLCLASYYKGHRFLERLKEEGVETTLLTVEAVLHEAWPRAALAEVFALPNFHDRRALANAVAYLARSRTFDRIVALDDFDVEVAAFLREHLRLTDTGPGESQARLFRDKLAMRVKAREIGVRVPDFCSLFHDDELRGFLAAVPGPWLVKPRGEASAAGIHKFDHPDDVWKKVDELKDDRSFALIEKMVPGDLFHVDSLSWHDMVVFAEVNGYRRPLLDVYQGGGVYATATVPRDHPDVAELRRLNAEVLGGFGLGWGASHTEFMKSHADSEFYFIETSARVGGANTAEMVEAATGVNLWGEWAKLEICRTRGEYELPELKARYGGVLVSLAKQERPDTSGFADPEIVFRADLKNHIGLVLAADTPERIAELQADYGERIRRDFTAVLPAAQSAAH